MFKVVILKDLLHNLSASENGDSHEYSRGVLVGVVGTLMSCGMEYEDALQLAWQCSPMDCHPERIPAEWREEWRKLKK